LGYGLISIGLALSGFGVLSLVYGMLTHAALRSVLFWLSSPHHLKPIIAMTEMKGLVGFGAGLTASRFLNFAALNGDYFIAGRLLGAEALGLYSRAFYIMRVPTTLISSTLHSVLFPAFSQIQNDRPRLLRGYLTAVMITSALTMPVMVTLAIIAPEMIRLFFGEAWTGTVKPLQLLCPVGVLGLYTLSDALLKATGQLRKQMMGHTIFALILLGGVAILAKHGTVGVAYGVLLANAVMYCYMASTSLKVLDGTWQNFIQCQIPAVIIGVSVGAIGVLVRFFALWANLPDLIVMASVVMCCSFTVIAFLFLPFAGMEELRFVVYDYIKTLYHASPNLPFRGLISRHLPIKMP
jgi:PST family polysaccharide transporter